MSYEDKQEHTTAEPNTVERVGRIVIEKKLLSALGEGKQVAVLFTESDLEVVATACRHYATHKSRELEASFRQLLQEAFPK